MAQPFLLRTRCCSFPSLHKCNTHMPTPKRDTRHARHKLSGCAPIQRCTWKLGSSDKFSVHFCTWSANVALNGVSQPPFSFQTACNKILPVIVSGETNPNGSNMAATHCNKVLRDQSSGVSILTSCTCSTSNGKFHTTPSTLFPASLLLSIVLPRHFRNSIPASFNTSELFFWKKLCLLFRRKTGDAVIHVKRPQQQTNHFLEFLILRIAHSRT